MSPESPYDHDWPTCAETFASVSLYHDSADPADATSALGIEPSEGHRAGTSGRGRNPARLSLWSLTSQDAVDSRDLRAHLDYLIDRLSDSKAALELLTAQGWTGRIFVFWVSASGHGGPSIGVHQMTALAALGLELDFDIYPAP